VLREQIANGSANVLRIDRSLLSSHCSQRARRSLCHCLTIATYAKTVEIDRCVVSGLTLDATQPALALVDDVPQVTADDATISAWVLTLERLLRAWQ